MTELDQVTIDAALERSLVEQRERLSERTFRRYEEVVLQLRHCLDSYAYSSLSDGEQERWQQAYDRGDEQAYCHLFEPERIPDHLGSFLDWFMVRKVMAGEELLKAAGTVTGKLVRWLAQQGLHRSRRRRGRLSARPRSRTRSADRRPARDASARRVRAAV
jgi:hypothetical protein